MNVAVAGYGIEGKVNTLYWLSKGAQVTVLDEKDITDTPDGVMTVTGPHAFENLAAYDLVVRTASLRPDKLSSAKKIWSGTNEFFAECPAPIIGVTGTKGKGTTSSLIASMLQAAGKTVHLVGNIGVAALEVLPTIAPDDVVVFEMSSFQLWDLEKSPRVAVVLMIEPDHMDVHAHMDEYVRAKSNITAHQSTDDVAIYHPTNGFSREAAQKGSGKKIRYGVPDDGGAYVESNKLCIQGKQICELEKVQIPGQHNLENVCAAITAVLSYDPNTSFDAIAQGLSSFTGLQHRLKFIRELDGVKYYDDNYSSAPGATIAAMRAFTEPEVLIMGGYDKGVEFMALATATATQANVKRVILIGQTKNKIATALDAAGRSDVYELSDESALGPIVEKARSIAAPGDVVIMSPGCASFDMFKNFSDRGDQFIQLVEGL